MKNKFIKSTAIMGIMAASGVIITACGSSTPAPTATVSGVKPQDATDMLHAVMDSDRTIYTKMIISRLVNKHKLIKASEFYEDDVAAPLPAQVFRLGAEAVAERTDKFSYSLQSLWPINKPNAASQTEAEKTGLKYVVDNPGENYYTEEVLGGQKYFTAVYADVAVVKACATCHNEHKDSPKTDFKVGDVMGGVVIRIPLGG